MREQELWYESRMMMTDSHWNVTKNLEMHWKLKILGAESSDGCGLIGSDTDTVDSLDAVLPLLTIRCECLPWQFYCQSRYETTTCLKKQNLAQANKHNKKEN